jgi:hypothetical protein
MLAWPSAGVLATIHHHKQVWWVGRDASIIGRIEKLTGNTPAA